MRMVVYTLLLSVFCTVSYAAEVSSTAGREIAALLETLGTSECRFYRNGSWYSASDAQAHLTRKYEYLRQKKLVENSDDFILKGGTKSSRSEEPYQVQCGNEPAVPSSEWLGAVLHQLRSSPSSGSSSK